MRIVSLYIGAGRYVLESTGELLFEDVEQAPIVSLELTVDAAAQAETVV